MSDKITLSPKVSVRFAKILGIILLIVAVLASIFIDPRAGLYLLVFSLMLLIPSYGNVEYLVHKFFKIRVVAILSILLMIIASYYISNYTCERRGKENKEPYQECMAKKYIGYISGRPYLPQD